MICIFNDWQGDRKDYGLQIHFVPKSPKIFGQKFHIFYRKLPDKLKSRRTWRDNRCLFNSLPRRYSIKYVLICRFTWFWCAYLRQSLSVWPRRPTAAKWDYRAHAVVIEWRVRRTPIFCCNKNISDIIDTVTD